MRSNVVVLCADAPEDFELTRRLRERAQRRGHPEPDHADQEDPPASQSVTESAADQRRLAETRAQHLELEVELVEVGHGQPAGTGQLLQRPGQDVLDRLRAPGKQYMYMSALRHPSA